MSIQPSPSMENTDKNTGSIQGADGITEGLLIKPVYLFIPVDRYGDNALSAEPLKDLGIVVVVNLLLLLLLLLSPVQVKWLYHSGASIWLWTGRMTLKGVEQT